MEHIYTIEFKNAVDNIRNENKLSIKTYIQEDIQPHNHNFFELAYITGGTTRHTLNDSSNSLVEGNYFIVDYGSKHSYKQSKNLTLINCLFLPEIIDDTLIGCHSFEDLIHICLLRYYKLFNMKSSANQIFFDDGGRILNLLKVMSQELEAKKIGYQEILKNRLMEIIIITIRNIMHNNLLDVKMDITQNMMDYIHHHYREHKLLTGFCDCYHYSPQYISRTFKQETGLTVTEYLQKIRVEKSCELLAGSYMSVPDVSEAVGYMDTKSFTSLFRKMIHMSPREYRKRSEK